MTFTHLSENPRQQARAWNLPLGIEGFRFADLNRVRRLEALDRAFLASLRESDAGLAERFVAWRRDGGLARLEESRLLMEAAPHLAAFVARLFRIESEHAALCARIRADEVIFEWKRKVVERKVVKTPPSVAELQAIDPAALESAYREAVDAVLADAALSADPERELAEITTRLLDAVGGG